MKTCFFGEAVPAKLIAAMFAKKFAKKPDVPWKDRVFSVAKMSFCTLAGPPLRLAVHGSPPPSRRVATGRKRACGTPDIKAPGLWVDPE